MPSSITLNQNKVWSESEGERWEIEIRTVEMMNNQIMWSLEAAVSRRQQQTKRCTGELKRISFRFRFLFFLLLYIYIYIYILI